MGMELSLTVVRDGLRHYRCCAFGFCYLREFNYRGSMIPPVEQRHLKDTMSIPPRRIDTEHWWNGTDVLYCTSNQMRQILSHIVQMTSSAYTRFFCVQNGKNTI